MGRLLLLLCMSCCSALLVAAEQNPLYFHKLYEGDYRPRWDVAYLQVQATNGKGNDIFRPATMEAVDGKPITDDTVPYELAPGPHRLDHTCHGNGKIREVGSSTVTMQPGHVYEVEARSNGEFDCLILVRDFGVLRGQFTEADLPPEIADKPGEPLPTSIGFNSIFQTYENDNPGQFWPELTAGMYRFIQAHYACDRYEVLDLEMHGAGRLWRPEGATQLSVKGNISEEWKIRACGAVHRVRISLAKPGNAGKYISIDPLR